MAASLRKFEVKVLQSIYSFRGQPSYCRLRQYSTSVKGSEKTEAHQKEQRTDIEDDRLPQVGMSPDGQVLVAWHPEPTHPYEHTKPLPRSAEELRQGESVLNPKILRKTETRYRRDGPTVAELSNLFFTSKHRWYPKSERRKAVDKKKIENEDRDHV